MRQALIFLTLCIFIFHIQAQSDTKVLNVSLWNPVSTVPYDFNNTNIISIGLPQSKVNDLKGVSINAIGGVTTGKLHGIQIAGFHSKTEGPGEGLTFAGLYNIHKASFTGFSGGGLMNLVMVNSHGVQLSAVQNITMFDVSGLQLASLMNVAGNTLSGMQISLGFNVATYAQSSVQLASIVNFGLERFSGVQVAAFNYATDMNGLQLGVVNFSRRHKGVQIGIANYSADSTVLKLGLISISPRTKIRPVVYYSNLATLNTGMRFMNRYTYTIFGIGTPYDAPHTTSSGLLFYRLGIYQTLGDFTFSADAGISYITKFLDQHEKNALSMEGRFNLEYAFNKSISLMCSGGYSVRKFFAQYKPADLKPIVEFGLILPNLLRSK
jgi:hypothetical protein